MSPADAGCTTQRPADVTFSCPSWQVRTDLPVEVLLWDRDEVLVGVGHQIVVLDAATGQVRWHRDLSAAMLHQPAVETDAVYVLAADGTVTAFDRATGAVRWHTSTGRSRLPPAVTAGTLLVESSRGVTGLDTADGTPRWEVTVAGGPSPPAAVWGWVFVGDGNGAIRAIEALTGRVAWVANANGWYVAGHPHQPAVAVAGFSSPLIGLDRATGEQVWESDIDVGWAIPEAMSGGRAFVVRTDDGLVHLVDASDGTSTQVAQSAQHPVTVTVDVQGLLYVTDADGLATAITPDGQPLWTDSWHQGVGSVATGWVNGGPWLFVVDGSGSTLAGLPGVRRPPPQRVDAVTANQACPVTPLQERPYRTVAAGHFIELSGAGILPDGTYETTSVSVTGARTGPVTLTGRRLDAPGTMTFLPSHDDEPVPELVLASDGFRLGGPDGMPPHWAVLVSDLEPGCWSYDLHHHDGQVDQVIVNITS